MRRPHRAAHSAIWAGLAIAIPGLIVAAFLLQQDYVERRAPERLSPPAEQPDAGARAE